MSREKKVEEPIEQDSTSTSTIEFTNNVTVPLAVREEIERKALELKTKHGLRKIFIAVVQGEEEDDKPFYIGYFRRPGLVHFSQYMNFVQKDLVQANKMLANNVFLGGDRELVDDDELFLYGTMSQLTRLIDSRNSDMVKR